jgi:2,3-diaminopropionate biosynthesis protein SbnA
MPVLSAKDEGGDLSLQPAVSAETFESQRQPKGFELNLPDVTAGSMAPAASWLVNDKSFIRLRGFATKNLFAKIEGLNLAGSIKLKTALGIIGGLEASKAIKRDSILIESSSGNLGVAVALVAAERGYRFCCVVDPNASHNNVKIMRVLGAEVITVTERDENGGFLGTRIRFIRELIAKDKRYLWLNQYANPDNALAHARTTACAIAESFERIDYLFVGAGTTGTLMGCVQFFKEHRPATRIVAVDSAGSVTFGAAPGKRYIPGLGSSRRPEIFEPVGVDAFELVAEVQTVAMCRRVARTNGFLAGGSTGTVLAAIDAWGNRLAPDAVVVAICPDLGERYLDTIYDDAWVAERFGPEVTARSTASGLKRT